MRFRFFISFASLVVLVFELVAMPFYVNTNGSTNYENKDANEASRNLNRIVDGGGSDVSYGNRDVNEKRKSGVVSGKETCCAKKAAGSACSKNSDGGTEGPECCVNCPLFQIMIMPQLNMPVKAGLIIEREYAAYQANYLFTYCPSAWKPPNAC